MEKKYICKKRNTLMLMLASLVAVFVSGCVYIDSISVSQVYNGKEVDYAYAGDVATFTIKGHIECHEDHSGVNFVVGFLAPKSWDVANNAKVTYTCDLADDRTKELTMSVIPASQLPKNGNGRTWSDAMMQDYGVGPNVLDDMEWVVFQTDQKWDIINNQVPYYTIYIRTNVGEQNLKCHLGFMVNHTDDGLSSSSDHKKVNFSDVCFEVVGGKGATIDFCNNHYNKVAPMSALQDDYVTFSFLGDAADNDLVNGDIYLQATAVTESGKEYKIEEKSSKTLLRKLSEESKTYNITIWPGGFFGLPQDEVISYINYIFTNKDGSVEIGQSDDDYEQLGIEKPEQRVPFTFQLKCD